MTRSPRPTSSRPGTAVYAALLLSLAACGAPTTPAAPPPQALAVAASTPSEAGAAAAPLVAPPAPSEGDAAVPIAIADATLGNRDALVTLVAFGDFQCPFTARAAPTIARLVSEYSSDKLRFVWKNQPLPSNPLAHKAAEASEGVWALGGSSAFWRFFERAFAEQAHISDAAIVGWANEAGVDMARFTDGMTRHAWAAKVDGDLALSKQLHSGGTPSFFINGVRVRGAQGAEKFEAVIDAELARARVLVGNGVPRDRVYAVATSENVRQWPAPDEGNAKPDTTIHRVPVGDSPVRGPKDALVTIVEFGDFECPFTRQVQPALEKVRATYGEQVRIVWKNAPLPWHPRSRPAAELALEARAEKGDPGFWAAHDALFASQPGLEDSDLERVGRTLALDAPRVTGALSMKRHQRVLLEDESLGDDLSVNTTPQFYVNGQRLLGAAPFESFAKLIDGALAKARGLVATGIRRDRVYDAIMKTAIGPAEPEKRTFPRSTTAPVRGAATAPVAIEELGDFQSPYTRRAEEALAQVLQDYGGRVKIAWRNLPLAIHADAELAAEAAFEAYEQGGDAAFWKMHDLLLANQQALDRAALDGYAAAVGLDVVRFSNALDHHTHKGAIDTDAAAAREAGVSGTPAFSINGYYLYGVPKYVSLRKLVERALADVRAPGN